MHLPFQFSHFIYLFYVFFNATVGTVRVLNVYDQPVCQIKVHFHWLSPLSRNCYSVFQPMCRGIMNLNAFANSARSLSTSATSCSVLFCDLIVLSRFFNCCCLHIKAYDDEIGDMRYRSWLRHNATSWKVAGSRPDDITNVFFFNLPNPSSRIRPWSLLSI
jgi:hypothetical protein